MSCKILPPPHFILNIFVNNEKFPQLRKKYEEARDLHNKTIYAYLADNKNATFNAGFDLYIPKQTSILAGEYSFKVPHGIHCSMKKIDHRLAKSESNGEQFQFETDYPGFNVGFYLYLRSSTGGKTPLRLSNHVGIIDSNYRGEIAGIFDNMNVSKDYETTIHQRLLQICPPDLSYPIIVNIVDSKEQLGFTERNEKGFGSTGV